MTKELKRAQAIRWYTTLKQLFNLLDENAKVESNQILELVVRIISAVEGSNLLSIEVAFIEFYGYLDLAIEGIDKTSLQTISTEQLQVLSIGAMLVSLKYNNDLKVSNSDFSEYFTEKTIVLKQNLNQVEKQFLEIVDFKAPRFSDLIKIQVKYASSEIFSEITKSPKQKCRLNSLLFRSSKGVVPLESSTEIELNEQKKPQEYNASEKSRPIRSLSFGHRQAN